MRCTAPKVSNGCVRQSNTGAFRQPASPCDLPLRHVAALADRRGAKSTGSRKQDKNGKRSDAHRSKGGQREATRDADVDRKLLLQRDARRHSARAEGIGAARVALQERMEKQAADADGDDGWGSSGADQPSGRNPSRLPLPLPKPSAGGGGGNRQSLWPREATGANGRRKEQRRAEEEDEELWPSREAVLGPKIGPESASTVGDDASTSMPGRAGGNGGGAAAGAALGGPAGLVAALRAAQSADRQARLDGGGGAAGARVGAVRRMPQLDGVDGGAGGGGGGDGELVPFADLVLRELGLPPRPKGRNGARVAPTSSGSVDDEGEDTETAAGRRGRGSSGYADAYDDGETDDDSEGSGREGRSGGGRGRGAKRGALKSLLSAYQRVWCRALDLELQEEWVESEERLKSWKRPRLEAEGSALFDLSAAPDHTLFRDAVLRFFLPGRPLPYHVLGPGDIVLVSPLGRPSDASMEGVVLDFSSRWIRVALPADQAAGVQGGGWRLDLYANTIAHERARGAVQRFCQAAAESGAGGNDNDGGGGSGAASLLRALAGGLPAATSLEQIAAASPSWLRGKAGRERLTAARRVVAAATAAPAAPTADANASKTTGARQATQALPQGVDATVAVAGAVAAAAGGGGGGGSSGRGAGGLNASQARAVEVALGRSLTLWQGPPGTGKTATLLRFIAAARSALPASSGPLLATSASNVAVDNLVSGLLATAPQLSVVRVGQPAKVAPGLRGVSLEARIAGTSAGQRAAALRRKAVGLRGSEAWAYISQALELEEGAARDILSRADVVAATCIGCGEPRMQALRFPVVVLDEATQATEPHSLVPLLGQVEQLVLVGDPQQLPPTVQSREAEGLGLGLPLFERLQLMGLSPLLLDTQYRMHPAIAAFPSAAFYGGRLRSAPTPRERPPPRAFPWPNPKVPVCFIPVRGTESRTAAANDAATPGGAAGFSYQNEAEAAAAAGVLAALLTPGGGLRGPGDVGVITPYNGQVRCLQQLVTRGSSRLPRGDGGGGNARPGSFQRSSAPGGSDTDLDADSNGGQEASVLEIKSVDGFQGREKEVIVFSAVRSNPEGRLGFVSDLRRLNVAITRARRGLIVIGNPDTLATDKLWARWLRWATEQGCVLEGGWAAGGGDDGREGRE